MNYKIYKGRFTVDGDGVRLYRILPIIEKYNIFEINPFLLLDEFKSDREEDYKGGFPTHPHRGFQTITYMKIGSFEHRDSLGNQSRIKGGEIQWMVAGSGIYHSEMPILSNDKKLWGFQLWLNLPQKYKSISPFYKNITDIPSFENDHYAIKLLFGKNQHFPNFFQVNPYWDIIFLDVLLKKDSKFIYEESFENFWTIIYNYDSLTKIQFSLNKESVNILLEEGTILVLDNVNLLEISSSRTSSGFLILSSPKLDEPIKRNGPFVD